MQLARCSQGHARHSIASSGTAVTDSSTAWRVPPPQQQQQQHQHQQHRAVAAAGHNSSSSSSNSCSRGTAVSVRAGGKGFGGGTIKKGIAGLLQKKDLWGGRQPVTPHQVSPMRPVPRDIPRPPYADTGRLPDIARQLQVHNAQGLAKMRAACQLAARVLAHAGTLVRPGVTTDEIDAAVHDMVVAAGAYPSPLGYHGFPKSVCTSVNEVVCHGVPDSRPLADGDVINIDVTAFLDGYHGDTNATFAVGTPSDAAAELLETTQAALQAAIDVCGPGVPFRAIGAAVERVAVPAGMTVIRGFVGHGIGRVFHAAPAVLHHRNLRQGEMQLWQTFTIEPILSLGSRQDVGWAADRSGWTRVTADGALTAQFEHTLMITEDGCEVLTTTNTADLQA